MFKDQILENENRRKIYSLIKSNPGIHLRELQRVSNLPLSTVNYHTEYLRRRKIILNEKEGNLARFYAKHIDENDKRLLKVLRQKRLREIVLFVLVNRRAKSKFIAENLDLPRSTLSFYLKYLVKHNVLAREKVGYNNIYTIINEDELARILVTYKSSFIDKLVDKTLNTWLETRFRK